LADGWRRNVQALPHNSYFVPGLTRLAAFLDCIIRGPLRGAILRTRLTPRIVEASLQRKITPVVSHRLQWAYNVETICIQFTTHVRGEKPC
jgi:hypothetical protein